MARRKLTVDQLTPEQLGALEDLNRAAKLRVEATRYYLLLFRRALDAGVGTSVLGRYVGLSPQAANSTKNRLALDGPDDDAPATIAEVVKRARLDAWAIRNRPSPGGGRRGLSE